MRPGPDWGCGRSNLINDGVIGEAAGRERKETWRGVGTKDPTDAECSVRIIAGETISFQDN